MVRRALQVETTGNSLRQASTQMSEAITMPRFAMQNSAEAIACRTRNDQKTCSRSPPELIWLYWPPTNQTEPKPDTSTSLDTYITQEFESMPSLVTPGTNSASLASTADMVGFIQSSFAVTSVGSAWSIIMRSLVKVTVQMGTNQGATRMEAWFPCTFNQSRYQVEALQDASGSAFRRPIPCRKNDPKKSGAEGSTPDF
jgi:hypothetical protein